mgnify:CR=1 FL=1
MLLTILSVLSIAYFVGSWTNGIEISGTHVHYCHLRRKLPLACRVVDYFGIAPHGSPRLGRICSFTQRCLHGWLGMHSRTLAGVAVVIFSTLFSRMPNYW